MKYKVYATHLRIPTPTQSIESHNFISNLLSPLPVLTIMSKPQDISLKPMNIIQSFLKTKLNFNQIFFLI